MILTATSSSSWGSVYRTAFGDMTKADRTLAIILVFCGIAILTCIMVKKAVERAINIHDLDSILEEAQELLETSVPGGGQYLQYPINLFTNIKTMGYLGRICRINDKDGFELLSADMNDSDAGNDRNTIPNKIFCYFVGEGDLDKFNDFVSQVQHQLHDENYRFIIVVGGDIQAEPYDGTDSSIFTMSITGCSAYRYGVDKADSNTDDSSDNKITDIISDDNTPKHKQ